jgi:DNA-binding FadR family transcriptional regulator
LRTSFELSTRIKDGPRSSLPMHRAVLDAVIAHSPAKAERALMVLINGANDDIEKVLSSRRKLPRVAGAPTHLRRKMKVSEDATSH